MPESLSGAVLFSVETLLYYAPKITRTGDDLTAAVDRAQRQLTGLGDFFGDSWPDEPFRDSYPRAQWAMLIIARQIADEIRGIGAGIEQMARTYGLAEQQGVADARRLQGDQSRTDARVAHSGGLPKPPVIPDSKPHSTTAVNPFAPHPDPTAGPAPVPPGATIGRTSAAVPAPISSSSFTAKPQSRPAGPLLPDPQPGTDPTTWNPRDATSFLGPWPSGDPARMDEAADVWKALTAALDDAWAELQRYTAYIMADCQGKAADLFQDYADTLTGHGHGLLFRAIDLAQELRNTCENQANEIRQLKSKLEEIVIEIAATFVIGQVLSMLTFGAAEEATAALEAGMIARISAWTRDIFEAGTTAARVMNTGIEGLAKGASAMIVGSLQSTAIGAGDLAATNVIGRAFGDKPIEGTAALKAIAEDGGIGMFFGQGSAGGLLGVSAAAASKRLIKVGETLQKAESADRQAAGDGLVRLGLQLKGSSITVAAANAAATQLITQHEITPLTFITGTISNRFTNAISPATGAHAKG